MLSKMDWTLVPMVLLGLIAVTLALDSNSEHRARETPYSRKEQFISQNNGTQNKGYRMLFVRRTNQNYSSNKIDHSNRKSQNNVESEIKGVPSEDEKNNEDYFQSEEIDSMLMASAGRSRKNNKSKRGDDDDDDEDKKTLSQQIADGKYGLIEKEIYATTPKRPGIISYASNPEVPRDNAKNLGGLEPEEIWLAENHVLVLRGGYFPEHKFNRTDETATAWPPIDPYKAPPRQVKIPANPKVPPPFPVQLTDDGPTQFIGFNGTAGPPPFPPFFPQPPPGNGSYFAPPFPFPPPPGNLTPGGGFYPPPGNGSFFPPQLPFPLPPPRNGSFFVPPPGNFPPGSGPFYPPPFPGFPPNSTIRPPLFPLPLPPNGSLPFPPPFLQNLPPGAAFLPPPGNLTTPFDEDDPSIYYPPPYDFYYPQDNSTEVPPGPLVPGIILPPPPNFFAPLDNHSDEQTTQQPKPPIEHTPEKDTPHRTYLPASRTQVNKDSSPSVTYLPAKPDVQKTKFTPTVDSVYNDAINQVTPSPEINVLTTPAPESPNYIEYTDKPPRPPINIVPQNVQVTHQGSSQVQYIPQLGYYYEEPTIVVKQPPETVFVNNVLKNDVQTTLPPPISYYTAPVTDIVVQPTPKSTQSPETRPQTQVSEEKISQKQKTKPGTTLSPLIIFYNPRQSQEIETNTVTPTPQPYYIKSQDITPTISPIVYYTVPSASKENERTSIKTSYYFYEPHDEPIRNGNSYTTTQATLLSFDRPKAANPVSQYNSAPLPSPNSARGRTGGRNMRPQYLKLPPNNSPTYTQHEGPQSEAPPTQKPATIRPQTFSDAITPSKIPVSPQQYIYSDITPVEQVKNVRQRTRTQQYLLSSILPLGQQVIYSNRPKVQYISSTPSPQYYYVTASPGLQYNIVGSSTPAIINGQSYVKPTPQPIVSNLAYFTTPRPNIAYQNIISTQSPIIYNIQPSSSPRPIYQYSFESNKNPSIHEQNLYTTPRPKSRPLQKVNYEGNRQAAVVLPVQYQTTPRTLFEYSYEQQGLSTVAPQVQGYYSAAAVPQYNQDVTAGSPTTHYGYEENREQNQPSQSYQTTPRPNYNRYQSSRVNAYPTANPLHAYFTRQDESLLDDITKKYFTIFGQKLQDGNGPTTPIPSYTHENVANRQGQYYTTPSPKYNFETGERPLEADNGRPVALADDINVNYKKPLPPVNPLSEYIDTRQSSDSETGGALVSYKFPGDGGHFYFITPQLVGPQSRQSVDGYVYSLPAQQPELGIRYRRKKRKEQR